MFGKDDELKEDEPDANPKTKADEVSSPDVSKETSRGKKDLKDELKKVKKDRDDYLDGWKRAKADLINYKRDELRRLEQVVQFANEEMINDVIIVLDSFELAIASMEKDNPAEKGTHMIMSKLQDVLKKRGVSRIEVNEGDKFDPNFHEAVTTVSAEGKEDGKSDLPVGVLAKEGTIAEELGAGYILYGKVIRAAKVKVYK